LIFKLSFITKDKSDDNQNLKMDVKLRMKQVFLKFHVVLICLIWLCPISSPVYAKDTKSKPLHKVTLQLRWLHQFQFAGFYAAIKKKFYEQEGLEVEIKQGGFNLKTVDEVVTGRAQFGVTNSEILLSRLKDKKPVVVLAAIFQHSPLVFIARKETHITNPQEFIGKRVKITKQIRDLELHATLFNEGLNFDQFELIDGPWKKEHMFDKTIDVFSAYITNEPYYYTEKNIEFNIVRPSAYGVDFYGDCIFTAQDLIAKQPSMVAAFKRASLKGWEYAMSHKDEIINLILKEYVPDKTRSHLEYEADTMDKLILPGLIDMGHINPGRWKSIADVFVQHGVIPQGYSLEGFIFNPDPEKDYFWVWVTLSSLVGITILFSMISITLYVFNHRLNQEVKQKEKSQKALSQSEARLKAMFENIHSGVVILSPVDKGNDFIVKGVNKAAQKIDTVTLEEVMGKPVSKVFPDVSKFELFKVFQRVYATGNPEHMPTSRYKDGQIMGWRENFVYKLPSGEIAVVYNDETIRKKAEMHRKHLDTINQIIINSRHTKKMLKNILDAMLDIFESDRAWLVYPCDPEAEYYTVSVESTRPQWPGLGVSGEKTVVDTEIKESMKSVLDANGPVVDDVTTGVGVSEQMARKFHIKSAIRMAAYPKIDKPWMLGMHRCEKSHPWTSEEKLLFNSIGRRISDGLNAILLIQELKRTNKILMESEDRFAKIFNSSPVGIVIATLDELKIININQSFLRIAGCDEQQAIGKSILSDDFFVVPESRSIFEDLKHNDSVGPADIKFYQFKKEVRDGRLSSQKVMISQKHCIILTIEDITAYKKAENEKMTAQKHAAQQEKYALIGQIAGKMAHDFNNILGSIMGNTELSLLDCEDVATIKTLELILEQTKRGRSLTKDLVAFAKDQEPRQDFFNINEKIFLVLNLLKKDLEGIAITTSFAEPIPELLADPGMIENALVNIIHNAIHAMSKKEMPLLNLRTYSKDENILIEIEDNGCGIPKEHQNSIYAPAFTLKNNNDVLGAYDKSVKGTGYGLFNVKKIIQKHNGRIRFETKVDKGTRFLISLPIIKKDLTIKEKAEVKKLTLYKARKILIVEDEQSIANVQCFMLTHEPFFHRVDVALNGQMALDLMGKKSYDLISLDYRLPGGLSGMDLYTIIREKNKSVPILFISGNMEFLESLIPLTKKDKHLDYLSKPCQNKAYADCINRLFELSEI